LPLLAAKLAETTLHNEQALLIQVAEGKEEAFAVFYHYYYSSVQTFLQKFLKSPQLSEDLTQEVFSKIWQNRSRLTAIDSFRAYLFVAARNHALTALRTLSRHELAAGEIVRHYQLPVQPTDDLVLTREYMLFLQQTLDTLPQRTRRIFRLCRDEGKSYEEVAALLGISRNAVKNHMVQAMKVLKTYVEKELGIPLAVFLAFFYGDSGIF
jgi:RNA polymerase sigma-70 factor (ECF subfamily)